MSKGKNTEGSGLTEKLELTDVNVDEQRVIKSQKNEEENLIKAFGLADANIDEQKIVKSEKSEEEKLIESHLISGWKLVQEVLQVYKVEEKIKRKLRKKITCLFLWILFIELIGIFALITSIGLGLLTYESDKIITTFITTTFVELAGIITYIVINIFKSDKTLIKIIEKIVSGINPNR